MVACMNEKKSTNKIVAFINNRNWRKEQSEEVLPLVIINEAFFGKSLYIYSTYTLNRKKMIWQLFPVVILNQIHFPWFYFSFSACPAPVILYVNRDSRRYDSINMFLFLHKRHIYCSVSVEVLKQIAHNIQNKQNRQTTNSGSF